LEQTISAFFANPDFFSVACPNTVFAPIMPFLGILLDIDYVKRSAHFAYMLANLAPIRLAPPGFRNEKPWAQHPRTFLIADCGQIRTRYFPSKQ
jgi:hypothetical protein